MTEATAVQTAAFRLVAAAGRPDDRARILEAALVGCADQLEFMGALLVELLGVTDGLSEDHPDRESLALIFGALAELADIVGGPTP